MARKEFSLWLMPTGKAYDKLKGLISKLSKKHSAPNFEPHVTLLGDIVEPEESALAKTGQLASCTNPFKIKLTGVKYLDEYFRCLFIRAEESDEIMQANRKAQEIFNKKQGQKFMPHLSLMYGNFPAETKEEIIAEIGKEFDTSFEAKSIHLILASKKIGPKDWKKIKKFTLK